MKKKCTVVMLATEKAENSLLQGNKDIHYHCGYLTQDYLLNELNRKSHHLYITSDDVIKKDDWFLWYSHMNNEYSLHKYHSDAGYGIKTYTHFNHVDDSSLVVNHSGVCGKIIATTDPALQNDNVTKIGLDFIKKFIERYNSKTIIEWVNVEYDILNITYGSTKTELVINLEHSFKPKLNLDDTIIIHSIQETFTKEDMKESFINGAKWANDFIRDNKDMKDFDTWLEENY